MTNSSDLICLSHLRWNFVFQRPQHLMTRFAKERRVFFFEEPVIAAGEPRLVVTQAAETLLVAVPHIPDGLTADQTNETHHTSAVSFGSARGELYAARQSAALVHVTAWDGGLSMEERVMDRRQSLNGSSRTTRR